MLYLAEYSDIGSTTRGSVAIPLEPPASEHAIEVGPNSVQSDAFGRNTCIVKLLSDEDCMIDIGTDPDATNSSRKLMAGKEQTVSVPVGAGFRVAVISANSGSVTGMDSLESLLKLLASPADAAKQYAGLKDSADKMTASAKDLRAAGDEARKMKDDLAKAKQDADDAKAKADAATAELAARESAFDKDAAAHASAVAADKAAADERNKELADREAAYAVADSELKKRTIDLADIAASLTMRDQELSDREAAVAAAQADYEARIAKLKALTA